MKKEVTVTRKTTESKIQLTLDFNGLRPDYRKHIKTPYPFLSHMLEHIAWRAGINIDIEIELDEFTLSHVVYEDLGITFGKAVREYILANRTEGAVGYGDAAGIIDEAMAVCAVSFEERALFVYNDERISMPEAAEGVSSEDLHTFLEGFCQGAAATLHVCINSGVNGHHIWEAVFRAFGTALSRAFYLDEGRKNMSAGVAGKIDFIIE